MEAIDSLDIHQLCVRHMLSDLGVYGNLDILQSFPLLGKLVALYSRATYLNRNQK